MDRQIQDRLSRCPDRVRDLYAQVREILLGSARGPVEEKLWAGLPSYYAGERFVRLIPFGDHLNIEAAALPGFADRLGPYRMTPKGMLQIFCGQELPRQTLAELFERTLTGEPGRFDAMCPGEQGGRGAVCRHGRSEEQRGGESDGRSEL